MEKEPAVLSFLKEIQTGSEGHLLPAASGLLWKEERELFLATAVSLNN